MRRRSTDQRKRERIIETSVVVTTEVPPMKKVDDAASVDSNPQKLRWNRPYDCPPVVNRSTILAIGLLLFGLAMIWPPLILLFAYIASKLVPYTLRENDDASVRRELYSQFVQDESLPERFRNARKYVKIEDSYWTNERYVHTWDDLPTLLCHGSQIWLF